MSKMTLGEKEQEFLAALRVNYWPLMQNLCPIGVYNVAQCLPSECK